jgi:hypothetical protein
MRSVFTVQAGRGRDCDVGVKGDEQTFSDVTVTRLDCPSVGSRTRSERKLRRVGPVATVRKPMGNVASASWHAIQEASSINGLPEVR